MCLIKTTGSTVLIFLTLFALLKIIAAVRTGDSVPTCEYEKDPGPCRGYFPRWYFSQKTQSCEEFTFGGCLGNRNNFQTEEDCKAECGTPLPPYPYVTPASICPEGEPKWDIVENDVAFCDIREGTACGGGFYCQDFLPLAGICCPSSQVPKELEELPDETIDRLAGAEVDVHSRGQAEVPVLLPAESNKLDNLKETNKDVAETNFAVEEPQETVNVEKPTANDDVKAKQAVELENPNDIHEGHTHEPMPTPARQYQDLQKPGTQNLHGHFDQLVFIMIVAVCSVAAIAGLVGAGYCWYRLQKNVKAASDVEYPAYGVTGPNKDAKQTGGDRKLAASAQMYHYQHQKQQMIAMEKASNEMKDNASDEESDEENEEGDYTVYECPGLAPTCEMEVKNPLFSDNRTPIPSDTGEDPHSD